MTRIAGPLACFLLCECQLFLDCGNAMAAERDVIEYCHPVSGSCRPRAICFAIIAWSWNPSAMGWRSLPGSLTCSIYSGRSCSPIAVWFWDCTRIAWGLWIASGAVLFPAEGDVYHHWVVWVLERGLRLFMFSQWFELHNMFVALWSYGVPPLSGHRHVLKVWDPMYTIYTHFV